MLCLTARGPKVTKYIFKQQDSFSTLIYNEIIVRNVSCALSLELEEKSCDKTGVLATENSALPSQEYITF